jgi:hypothetical protein
MGFIVDLTLTMDTLFWLTKQDPGTPITIRSINAALKIYKKRKGDVHRDIRMWVDEQGPLERLQPDRTVNKLKELMSRYRFQPETRSHTTDDGSDEEWIDLAELAD